MSTNYVIIITDATTISLLPVVFISLPHNLFTCFIETE